MSDKVYNVLKFVAQIGLPAFGTLYASLAFLPNNGDVVTTVLAVDLFLGTCLGLQSARYSPAVDGEVNIVTKDDGTQVMGLNSETLAEAVSDKSKKTIKLKVNHR